MGELGNHFHRHSHCHHDLKYCENCDIVYCEKCDREWGVPHYYHYTTPYVWYWREVPYTVTWGSTGDYTIYNSAGHMVNDASIKTAFYNSGDYKDIARGHTFQAQTGEMSSACTHHN